MLEMSPVMNIAMITDEGYAMPTGVAIYSLKRNRAATSRYCVYVLCNNVSSKTCERFMSMSEENFEIVLMNVTKDAEHYKRVELRNMHVTGTSLFKFDLPKYFPQLDKLLYVDGDVLIQHDLRDIYETDVSDVYLAAVEDMKAMTCYNPPILVKLGLDHKQYFHTGMMVMNLKKLRENKIPEKLLKYRISGINYFQDQDAFNAVTDEKVVYLSPLANYCFALDKEFTAEEILTYYHIENEPTDTAERQNKAIIFHMPGPYKPWRYNMPRLSDLYMSYYTPSPFGEDELILERLPENGATGKSVSRTSKPKLSLNRLLRSKNMGINQTEEREKKITVSLTSFPARISKVAQTLVPIMQQTVKPDRIVLCLAEQEFPQKEEELPKKLLKLREHGLEILWGENLLPHKKYLYTMKKYPDDIIITVDDDMQYDTDLVEKLMKCYKRHPQAVSALRAHLITFDDGKIMPYRKWKQRCSAFVDQPLMSLFATGMGGVLYPPHLLTFPDTLDSGLIKQICLCADDIWLKIMETLCNVPVVLAAACREPDFIKDTQHIALCHSNVLENKNDELMNAMLERYNEYHGEEDTLVKRIFADRRTVRNTQGASPKNESKPKRFIKKLLPMPVAGFMREITFVKEQQEDMLAYMKKALGLISDENERRVEVIEELEAQLEEVRAELKALREKQ